MPLLFASILSACLAMQIHATPGMTYRSSSDTSALLQNERPLKDPYLRLNEINIYAARDFITRYPAVVDDKWMKISGGYMAKFTEASTPVHVYYNEGGQFVAATRYLGNLHIPDDVREIVSKKFPLFTIITATEIRNDSGIAYQVSIKNKSFIKTLRVLESSVEIVRQMNNGEAGISPDSMSPAL